jgi:hypothetical protein
MRTNLVSLVLALTLTGCQYGRYTPAEDVGTIPGGTMPTTTWTTPTTPVTTPVDNDVDGDGHDSVASGGDDCNDSDAAVNPDMVDDSCDGVDQNCDDQDADAISDTARSASACGGVDDDGDGYMDVDGDGVVIDCDDTDPLVNPGADETTYNGDDDDCDATTLDDDLDQDGALIATDCDDLDSTIFPDAVEILDDGIDQNCYPADDNSVDDGVIDADADGFADTDDCDDTDPSIHPDAFEIINDGIDQDCDGWDGGDADCDGFVAEAQGGTDCDDTNVDINEDAEEVCGNEVDENCDGSAPGLGAIFPDVDDDGHGDINSGLIDDFACEDAVPEGFVYTDRLDCDDSDPDVYIGAIEVADDGIDQDCSGSDLVTVVEEPLPHPDDCAGGFSKVYGTFTGPVGSTITAISGERIPLVGSDDIIPWMAWSDGSPVNMTVDFVGNVGTFTLDACVDDAANWNASVTYTDLNGVVQYDCQASVFTGTWTVEFDNDVQTVTPEVWDLVNGSCNALW